MPQNLRSDRRRSFDVASKAPRVSQLDPRRYANTMKAWERFITGEPLPPELVRSPVVASWQRSAGCRISPDGREAPIAASGDTFERLLWRHHELLNAASGIFAATGNLLANADSIMILTNVDGVILDAAGDPHTLEQAQSIHLVPGGEWQESAVGTNGIGTAIAVGAPVQIHAAEHFCAGIKGWTCAAAPILEPGSRRVLGVLDISAPFMAYQPNNLTLAVAAARQIETVLAGLWTEERLRLMEACLNRLSRADAAGLIAIDRRGCLVYAAGKVPLTVALGGHVPGCDADRPLEDWVRSLPEGLRPEWFNAVKVGTETIGAMLVVPTVGLGRGRGGRPDERATRIAEQSSEADPARSHFAHIVGDSQAMLQAIERGRQLVGKRVPVLIEGETGVGKELFARALHGEEDLNRPYITFNCAATSKELIGDELFGHVRGAFTGANAEGRAGRFELADGGTLCLDEIGDMPLALQPVLLRALEEGVIHRLGDSQPRHVDVRLLALTNRNLLEEVEAGRFRRDLYHRISVTRIRVPPLRDRAGDIELLINCFNRTLAQRHAVAEKRLPREVIAVLKAYDWPGNVRELRNVIESLVLTCRETDVRVDELPAEILNAAGSTMATGSLETSDSSSLDALEKEAIRRALQSARGNLTQAAKALGISRSTLYRKVEHYHLQAIARVTDE
jgi:sigma-54 dependent transcriptional regulator, acetoin dehydrogenase operon transcriptional activator AcoR